MIGTASTHEALELRTDETVRLPRGRDVVVHVERGTVLVTQEGDRDDHVLEAGDAFVVVAGGLAVAWALRDARLTISATGRCLAA
jgi:uncharacterized cupin superfamily protein